MTAIVRNPDAVMPHERLSVVKGDVFEAASLTDALRGHEVVRPLCFWAGRCRALWQEIVRDVITFLPL